MTSAGTDCQFTFEPATWEAETDTKSPLVGELLESGDVWHCPHDAVEGRERCLFHLPVEEKAAPTVRDAFLSKITEAGQRPKQFIGARFGELRLDHTMSSVETTTRLIFDTPSLRGNQLAEHDRSTADLV